MTHRRSLQPVVLSVIIFTLLAGPACSLAQARLPGAQNQPGAGDPGDTAAGVQDENAAVRIVDQQAEPAGYDFPALGAISFQPDPTASTRLDIAAGPLVAEEMRLVDPAGLTWTLSIPAGALEAGQTLQMTALAGLHSDTIPGLLGGILLEPDGVQLLLPARLSVSGAGLDEHTLMLSATHSGADAQYALPDPSAADPGAQIGHFSTYFASRPADAEMESAYQQALQDYQQAAQAAKKLLKQPVEVPEPPSIPLECSDAEGGQKNAQQIADYLQRAKEPEFALAMRLLTLKRSMALTGLSEADTVDDLDLRLLNRQYLKAQKLMEQYRGTEEKLEAVSAFTFEVVRQLQLLGASPEASAGLLTEIAAWNEGVVDQLLEDISQNHNYKKIHVVLYVYKNASLLGMGDRLEEVLEKLENALKFEVRVNFTLDLPDEAWVTDSSATVQFDVNSLTTCSGEGQGAYTTASSPNATVDAPPYAVRVVVKDFDPCEGTVTVGFDRFGAESETYTIDPDSDEPLVVEMGLVQESGSSLYGDHASEGMYWFQMDVNNGNATTAEETFEQSKHGKVEGVLTVKLVHVAE